MSVVQMTIIYLRNFEHTNGTSSQALTSDSGTQRPTGLYCSDAGMVALL